MPQAGVRGINLSGGQRQRLNIARCAYFGGDLVLLDNALSAVDYHTAEHIFDHYIKTMCHDKATVLVTHQVRRAVLLQQLAQTLLYRAAAAPCSATIMIAVWCITHLTHCQMVHRHSLSGGLLCSVLQSPVTVVAGSVALIRSFTH